jgi:hypothetical protein
MAWLAAGGILDDQSVGGRDRLTDTDRLVIDTAEGNHRCPHALRAEARKRLRVPALRERRDRKQLGSSHDTLPAAPVDSDLKHDSGVGAPGEHARQVERR